VDRKIKGILAVIFKKTPCPPGEARENTFQKSQKGLDTNKGLVYNHTCVVM
jgi:hypothetical protein